MKEMSMVTITKRYAADFEYAERKIAEIKKQGGSIAELSYYMGLRQRSKKMLNKYLTAEQKTKLESI